MNEPENPELPAPPKLDTLPIVVALVATLTAGRYGRIWR